MEETGRTLPRRRSWPISRLAGILWSEHVVDLGIFNTSRLLVWKLWVQISTDCGSRLIRESLDEKINELQLISFRVTCLHNLNNMVSATASGDFDGLLATHGQRGWRGIFHNSKCLGITAFASLGGVLYGYNQGVFSQFQVMAEFEHRFHSTVSLKATT